MVQGELRVADSMKYTYLKDADLENRVGAWWGWDEKGDFQDEMGYELGLSSRVGIRWAEEKTSQVRRMV